MADRTRRTKRPPVLFGVLLLLCAPALHPLLIPYAGVTSHLLWWLHVAAVAQIAYLYRGAGAFIAISISFLLIIAGERLFGAGYGTPASWETALSLALAVALTNMLIATLAGWAGRAAHRLERAAFTNPLTGLPSRLYMHELLESTDSSRGQESCLIFLDLDDFDTINYSLGHTAGDQVLREVARRLVDRVGDDFIVAHWAGDKFALYRQDGGDTGLDTLIADIQKALRTPIRTHGLALNTLTAGIGVALQDNEADRTELTRMADMALSHAKQTGSSGFCRFSREMQESAHERLATLNDLNNAVENGDLDLVYQPIHDTGTGAIAGVETLVRWTHPERGPISPGVFIPMAERAGIINQLGEFVLQQALRDFSECRRQGLMQAGQVLNINVSPLQLVEPGFVDKVLTSAGEHDIDRESLVLEITETAMMQSEHVSLAVLRELTDQGIRLAIDDFGSGYSSLNYLHRLPVQVLKIDRVLVEQLCNDQPPLIRPITEIARVFGFSVIAEGVETEEQVRLLRELDVDQLQGFHLSRPMPLSALKDRLAEAGPLTPGNPSK